MVTVLDKKFYKTYEKIRLIGNVPQKLKEKTV